MKWAASLAVALTACVVAAAVAGCAPEPSAPPAASAPAAWSRLPDVPLATGGPFAGLTGGALVVAGGSDFPDRPGYEGGTKVWRDSVFVLPDVADVLAGREAEWLRAEPIPQARAYGASASVPAGLVVAGGGDARAATAETALLRWSDGRLERQPLPSLPEPLLNVGAAAIGATVYVAGGQGGPDAARASAAVYALDTDDRAAGWRALPPLPGPARILPAVAAHGGALYVASGAELVSGGTGGTTRRFLTDAYRYTPDAGWARVADLPRPAVAAPAASSGGRLVVMGGDDGSRFGLPPETQADHPGFPTTVLVYDARSDVWTEAPDLWPEPLVTTNAVAVGGAVVVPSGEVRPSTRSASVWAYRPAPFGPDVAAPATVGSVSGGFGALDWGVLVVYLALLVGVGALFSRSGTTDDFFLAGGRIPWWAAGLSIFGTQLSALTFMGIPAKAYTDDWVQSLVNLGIVVIAPVVVFFYLPFYRRLRVTSAYEYLELRFNVGARAFGAAAFVLFQLGRMGIVVALPAIALAAVTGLSVWVCIVAMGALATLYTVLGGIEAVIWTDVLQVVVLLSGAAVSLGVVVAALDGGWGELASTARSADKLRLAVPTGDWTTMALWVVVLGNVVAQFGPYTSDQAVVQRYLTTPTEADARRAIWTNAALTLPATALFFGVGTALWVFYQSRPDRLAAFTDAGLSADTIFPYFIAHELPAGVSGLVIAGLFAAAMSSLDSSMNSMAASIVTDGYRRFGRAVTEARALRLAKLITLVLGVVGTATALAIVAFGVASLWDLYLKFVGLFSGALAGLFALGIFTTRATGPGALVGAAASAVVLFLVQTFTDVHFFLYAAVGMGTAVAVGYLASFALGPRDRDLAGLTVHTRAPREALSPTGPRAPAP